MAGWRAMPRWFDARRLAAWPGEQRARRFVWLMLVLHRLSYLVPAVAGALGLADGHRATAANAALLAGAVGWNVVLYAWVQPRGWFTHRMVAIEVAVACTLLFAVTAAGPPGDELGPANWSTRYMLATGALLGAALNLVPALLVGVPVAGAYLAAATLTTGELPPAVASLNSFVWFLLIAHAMRRYLCAQGQALDELTRERMAVEASRSAERARHAERLGHHRALHDTVLATLTAIARGGLDHRADQVRQRCAQDAEYVRRLVEADGAAERRGCLESALIGVCGEAERLGLRVHYQGGSLPADLAPRVVDAVAGATREALNNVLAHSGTTEAWLTAICDAGVLTVRVVDRGQGFDPAAVRHGFGLRLSVADRIAEVGGDATVSSMPLEGTCVELVWPRRSRPGPVPDAPVSRADSAAGRPPVPGSPDPAS